MLADSDLPDMYRSDTGYAPCNQCQDIDTTAYSFNWWQCGYNMAYFPDSPCHCKVGYKSSNGLSPCEKCSEGSSTRDPYGHYCHYIADYYATGATVCSCIQGYFSPSGYDTDGNCNRCPYGTTTIELSAGTFLHTKNHLILTLTTTTIATSCRHCDFGWYSIDGLAASNCTQCPEGETTSGVGTALKCNQVP